MKFLMKCTNCGAIYTDEEETPFTCPKCTHPLNINIIQHNVGKKGPDFFRTRTDSMWKFLPFLPLRDNKNIISLGEGSTPLLHSSKIAPIVGCKTLLMKNETTNPTGSFMDRNVSMGISVANELGYNKAISLSTGNVGASVAAYSARAGFKSLIIVPNNYHKGKMYQIKLYGGQAIRVETSQYKTLMDLVISASTMYSAVNLATTSLHNAFTNHGAKTIVYEIFEQMDMDLPDLFVVPVGGAGLLSAVVQACLELRELELVPRVPDFLAVQPSGCHPFVYALRKNLPPDEVYANPWRDIMTSISSLASDVPFDYSLFYQLQKQMKQMNEGEVFGVTVSDEEVMDAQRDISRMEGLFVEPASATTLAGIKKYSENEGACDYDDVCLLLTGTGLLDIDQAIKSLKPPPSYAKDLDLERVIGPYFE